MPIDDQRRTGPSRMQPPANAWPLLQYHAHHRMAELHHEAEQERLVGLARKVRRGGSGPARSAAGRGFLDPALTLVAAFARHLVIARPRRGAR